MSYILDTNVVSESIKPCPATRVVTWPATQPGATIYLSVLTLGEIWQGIVRSPDPLACLRLPIQSEGAFNSGAHASLRRPQLTIHAIRPCA